MKKVSVIGHFGFGINASDGQTIKTNILADELIRQFGEENVKRIDTHGGIKTLLKSPFQVLAALKEAKNVIMLPAHNGLRVYSPLLILGALFFKGRKIHYVVIGGWLPEFLQKRKWLSKLLKKFDGIYVETRTMKAALETQGFGNIYVMPNCKKLTALKKEELVYSTAEPYRLCTFSRINEKKGIGDAVEAVRVINESVDRTVYALDIYGAVDAGQEDWFAALQKSFPPYVEYKGLVAFDKSVEVLKDYFALLFPTHYYTEGIPGTIIDAYAAGIPVISARWQSFGDMITEDRTGLGYEFENTKDLEGKLLCAACEVDAFNRMKEYCLEYSQYFTPNDATKVIIDKLI